MAPKLHEYPFSINLPPEMRLKLQREAQARGDMPIGTLMRMILTEWFALQGKRSRRKKKLAETEVSEG